MALEPLQVHEFFGEGSLNVVLTLHDGGKGTSDHREDKHSRQHKKPAKNSLQPSTAIHVSVAYRGHRGNYEVVRY